MNKTGLFLSLLLFSSMSILNATNPEVSNVIAAQRTDGSKIVDIWYDLEFTEVDSVMTTLWISEDAGQNFSIIPAPANLTGDFRFVGQPGIGKHIVWNMGAESRSFDAANIVFRIESISYVALPIPENFVYVEGGTFNNGTSEVTISSFYIDKFELTQASYQAVMGVNPSIEYGIGDNYPVYNVSWFDAVEYCNRRSLQDGLSPCYSYSTYGAYSDVWPSGWNSSPTNHTNISCNWTANGYRLPTKMERLFAAKGGNQSQGYTYSGSNDINAVAWYSSNSGNTTHQVGTKAANEIGIYDMSGNVHEWVWDIYDFGNYPSGPQIDPHGPTSGLYRTAGNGGWAYDWVGCTVSFYGGNDADCRSTSFGFRCIRISP